MRVTVTFDIEATSPQHALQVIKTYLRRKGIVQKGWHAISPLLNHDTDQKIERREHVYGYSSIDVH